jgi:hypothetical protein
MMMRPYNFGYFLFDCEGGMGFTTDRHRAVHFYSGDEAAVSANAAVRRADAVRHNDNINGHIATSEALDQYVHELTGDEGEDDSLKVLKRYHAAVSAGLAAFRDDILNTDPNVMNSDQVNGVLKHFDELVMFAVHPVEQREPDPAIVDAVVNRQVTRLMVDRFLGWQLPEAFNPDCFIYFSRDMAKANHSWPIGTNLFTAEQAREMLEYVLGLNVGPKCQHNVSTDAPCQQCIDLAGIKRS